jgi:hypothetical protein
MWYIANVGTQCPAIDLQVQQFPFAGPPGDTTGDKRSSELNNRSANCDAVGCHSHTDPMSWNQAFMPRLQCSKVHATA